MVSYGLDRVFSRVWASLGCVEVMRVVWMVEYLSLLLVECGKASSSRKEHDSPTWAV